MKAESDDQRPTSPPRHEPTPAPAGQITPADLWPLLTLDQQTDLAQTVVTVCCHLMRTVMRAVEAHDDCH